MSVPFLVYDTGKHGFPGQIRRVGQCATKKDLFSQAGWGEATVVDFDPDLVSEETHMVDVATKALVPRPGDDRVVKVNLQVGEEHQYPVAEGTRVRLDRKSWAVVDDGTLEIGFALPGNYRVQVVPPWPARAYRIAITVT